ncbi:hypothetical protein CCP3SC1_180028 [Gammaproteobacteria bacterium]
MKMNLLIEGWRNITHSFAMVNQYQILGLARMRGVHLYHRDIPHFFRNWKPGENDSGFDAEDQKIINDLSGDLPNDIDAVCRIHSPYNLQPINHGSLIVFIVTEFGLDVSEFGFNAANLDDFRKTVNDFESSGGGDRYAIHLVARPDCQFWFQSGACPGCSPWG